MSYTHFNNTSVTQSPPSILDTPPWNIATCGSSALVRHGDSYVSGTGPDGTTCTLKKTTMVQQVMYSDYTHIRSKHLKHILYLFFYFSLTSYNKY